VDLADVVEHVTEQAEATAAEAGIEARTDLGPAPAQGDPVLLERLVQNLVDNAIRHNAAGGWVTARTTTNRDGVQVVISNTGPVVAPYEVETIFQPFRRLGGERTSPERGFGLGLSIVAAIARSHGGRVAAVPREGGGLTVTVTLPARRSVAGGG
jgi:signal transduction histidine kinase